MTTMRSVEPLTGIDALVAWLFPFLAGSEPELGEHGIDSRGLPRIDQPAAGCSCSTRWPPGRRRKRRRADVPGLACR